MKIGSVELTAPFVVAPMAGMTDTAFRRLVKRHGGCGLVVTEMVSSEGLVRGIDRTLEYAEYTEEERPVSIQIFGGDPQKMADAAQIVEGMGADIVDVNMGCPVPKISKHNAGCSLMRDPDHAARVVGTMAKAVRIPVTVKMRAGWNDRDRNGRCSRGWCRMPAPQRSRSMDARPSSLIRDSPIGSLSRVLPGALTFRSLAAAIAWSPNRSSTA
jgi:tRNA-dihydrouridine synthase B